MEDKEYFIKIIDEKCPGAKPLFIAIRGSHAYGTNIPESDIDYSGVYIQNQQDIYGTKYKEQINDDKNDIVFYEVKRFLELIAINNPTVLELLNTPEDCIVYKDPLYDLILNQKDKFITKACSKSFGRYGEQQIKKAKGTDKKQNWEQKRVAKKTLLDFCFVIEGEKSIPWKKWNESRGFEETFIGIINVPHARDVYALYFDSVAQRCFSKSVPEEMRERNKKEVLSRGESLGFGYKGLVKTDGEHNLMDVNSLRVSSIPKGETSICNIFYNKDAYSEYCKDYKSYQTWIQERNEKRFVDVKSHGQKIDGKNMMHCARLLEMAREIGEGKGIIVRRPNAEFLLSIRRGEIDLQTLIDKSSDEIKEIERIFEESNLPEKIEPEFIHKILVELREKFYKKEK
jgi:uncharacterized protein